MLILRGILFAAHIRQQVFQSVLLHNAKMVRIVQMHHEEELARVMVVSQLGFRPGFGRCRFGVLGFRLHRLRSSYHVEFFLGGCELLMVAF